MLHLFSSVQLGRQLADLVALENYHYLTLQPLSTMRRRDSSCTYPGRDPSSYSTIYFELKTHAYLWSVGALLFQLVTGKTPFTENNQIHEGGGQVNPSALRKKNVKGNRSFFDREVDTSNYGR
ncbi:hypothetical protein Fot_21061 [Forsythia ovata]|uniref:Protein kinase domain-containing protein n=1 Tax=Forsythia ovata TaxID=205694 RepID=A0ABD1UTR8_9LAMI